MDINDFTQITGLQGIEELGTVRKVQQECPGVFYLTIEPDNAEEHFCQEYYLVLEEAPISAECRGYGVPLKSGHGLIFDLNEDTSGAKIVEYEALRYLKIHNLPLPDGADLREIAAYAAELYPEYFGEYPVPAETPWGHTVRHKTLSNGIYWLDTDRGRANLAVAFPIWEELSDTTMRLALCTDERDKEMGPRFFDEDTCCLAVFELAQVRREWIESGIVDPHALMNCIWARFPEYAVSFNVREQVGLHGILRALFDSSEAGDEPQRMITHTPGAGTNFFRWQLRTT